MYLTVNIMMVIVIGKGFKIVTTTHSGSGKLEVTWVYSGSEESYSGYIDLQWLRENTYSSTRAVEKVNATKPSVAVSINKAISTIA